MRRNRLKTSIIAILFTLLLCACSSTIANEEKVMTSKSIDLTEVQTSFEVVLDEANDLSASLNGDDESTIRTDDFTIHFLDVGQGLSVLIESDEKFMLYDGGDRDKSSFVVAYLKEQGVTSLEYVIASHYDADHINGVIGALNAFDVGTIIGPDYVHSSKTYQSFINKVAQLEKVLEHPPVGTEYLLGKAKVTTLSPKTISADSNNNSIAIKITNGDHSFIITGDAEHEEESDILDTGINLECNVLVAGHHGSASSTTWDFLQKTVPEYAIISCGKDNSYGHPHVETMEKLYNMGIEIFRTDEQGTIIAKSNGIDLTWNLNPSLNYTNGDVDHTINQYSNSNVSETFSEDPLSVSTYVINTNTKKIHIPSCSSTKQISQKNYSTSNSNIEEIEALGYTRCGNCLK